MVDPEIIPNADQHLREYQALQPPRIVCGAGSLELLATGTAKLTICVDDTAGIQREVNMSVMLVPGLGRNLLSSSAALANRVKTITSAFPALRTKGEPTIVCIFWTQSYRNCRVNTPTLEKRPA